MPSRTFLKVIGHAAADDDLVGLVEQIADERNLVRDLGSAEDGEERALRVVDDLGEGIEFLLHEETGGFLGQVHARPRKSGRGERCRRRRSRKCRRAWSARRGRSATLAGSALVEVPSSFFTLPSSSIWKRRFSSRTTSPGWRTAQAASTSGPTQSGRNLTRLAEEFLKFSRHRLERELLHLLAIGAAEVAHQDDRSALLEDVLDGGEGGGDAGGVGDGAGGLVLRHVEVHPHDDAFTREVDVA